MLWLYVKFIKIKNVNVVKILWNNNRYVGYVLRRSFSVFYFLKNCILRGKSIRHCKTIQSTEDFKQTIKHTISLFHIFLLQFNFLTIYWRVFISFLGLWAVVNTADVCLKGRIEMQESAQWETLFKTNVFGTFKAARTFYPLLVSQKGKQI